MIDYFMELKNKLSHGKSDVKIISSSILEQKMQHTFDLFEFGISDEMKYLYNNYKRFTLHWEDSIQRLNGFVDFVPYDKILEENKFICEIAKDMEADLIEEQDVVINDITHWYPIFKFPNGDAFCYDKRNGNVVFYDHEVFDIGINLHGLIISEMIDSLLDKWSRVLFVDIYDWYDGVNEEGIDLSKPVYKNILSLNEKLSETYIS